MLIPTQLETIPSSLLPMQVLLMMGNQFGQAAGSRWRGAHCASQLLVEWEVVAVGLGVHPCLARADQWAVVHGWLPALHSLCPTPSRPQLPPHCSFSSAPLTSVLLPWLSTFPPVPPSSHPATCSFPVMVLNSPASTAVPHSALLSLILMLLIPPPSCFLPLGLQSSCLHDFSRKKSFSSKETNSLWSLHSWTSRQCHAGGLLQGSLSSTLTVPEARKCVLPGEFFR